MPPGGDAIPTRRPVRPSSASANLQSHESFKSGLFDNKRPSTAAPVERPKTGVPKAHHWRGGSETADIEKIKLQRRPTLSTLEGLDESDVPRTGTNNASAGDLLKSKIEEKINIDTLELLKQAFQEADEDGSGELDLDEFKILLKSKLNLAGTKDQQIDALFYKIDWSSDGNITWDEFCTYMQLEYAEKEDSYQRSKDVMFHLPAKTETMPHRDTILKITDTDGTFIACSQDGIVSFWDEGLRLKRTRSVVPSDLAVKQTKQKWITDFSIMSQYNKIIIGTGDREIQFFELSSFEPYCQISLLETVPLHMDFCSTGTEECIILYGDTHGCVNILSIRGAGECLRTWKKRPKQNGIATISLNDAARGNPNVDFISWKVHGDWVQELRYYHDIRQVISCSNSTNTAFVIGSTSGSTNVEGSLKDIKDQGPQSKSDQTRLIKKDDASYFSPRHRLETDQSAFKVYKGVKTFAFSKSRNVIVTGGMDRIVRMWNPYVSNKPVALLRGHNAPIFYLFIASEENRVFSISTDKCVKIWDIQDQNCLLTVRPKGHKIRGDLQACHYSPSNKSLAVATDQMALLNLKLKPVLHADIVTTHKEPVTSAKYNDAFRQVLTCSEGSIVKLWDFETGNSVFDFGEAHGDAAITCLDFDTTGRRCLTGGRDGAIKIWNYNNGHCLMTLRNPSSSRGEGNDEICGLTYVEMNKNRYVVGVGWDRCINIYIDEPNDTGLHQLVDPQDRWEDDKRNGHNEDILSIAFCPPNLLATSSYDGEVIIWNMVSGHIFCHLWSPADPTYVTDALNGDGTVNQVIFMKTRAYNKDAASLIASGPSGSIHFWNVFQGGHLLAKFKGSKHSAVMITTLILNGGDQVLYSGDSYGFVHCWNVSSYALFDKETSPPELITMWRAHVENINSLDFIDEHKLLITASSDCSVRLWNKDGDYIGTFGQPEPWDIYNMSTWQHPMAPFDVLVDPMSMPEHEVIKKKANTHQVVHEDSAANSDGEEEIQREIQARLNHAQQTFHVDDNTIAQQLKERSFSAPKNIGKSRRATSAYDPRHGGIRLRHEKLKHTAVDRGGPSEYQMLRCYDLANCPQPDPPQLKINKSNPFDFYAAEDVGA
ncbi:cilia- and flagella-associated protein 337-like [Watersipora subatra]|uniref:cilia- and flagella-associated protein 337-like n=1 Tax=Watersipora subatra TaxID=2589382 RepID=UPI00355ACDED